MPILRHSHEQEFTILPNSLIRNPALSLRDVGLLCYMLSLPPDWDFSVNGLNAILSNNGRSSVRASLKNLENQGYLKRTRLRDDVGRITNGQWIVSDLPLDEPRVDFRHEDNRHDENRQEDNRIQTKNIINKENKNKEKNKQTDISFPSLQEIEKFVQENGFLFSPEEFYDYYTARGWMAGSSPILDWRAQARSWNRRKQKEGGLNLGKNELDYPWHIGAEI